MSKNLDYICSQLANLDVVEEVPENLPHRDRLVNRAVDVRSASMLYIAIQLKHDQNSFGLAGLVPRWFSLTIQGTVLKTIFTGDKKIMDTETYLKDSVNEYNKTMNNMNLRIIVKMYKFLRGNTFSIFKRLTGRKIGYRIPTRRMD